MKPYYYHINETDINYLEIRNDLSEKRVDKLANEEIHMLLDHLKP